MPIFRPDLRPDPAAQVHFDLGAPRRTADFVGDVSNRARQGPPGHRSGGCTWVDGPDGPCLRFDGTSGYLHTEGWAPDPGQAATMMIRLKLAQAMPSPEFKSGLVGLHGGSAFRSHYPYADGYAYLSVFRSSRVDGILPSPRVDRAAWHWLTITTRVGGRWRCYQDGEMIADVPAEPLDFGIYGLQVGRSDGLYYFHGDISEFLLLPRELSPAEVRARVAAPRRARPGGLLARLARAPAGPVDPAPSGRLVLGQGGPGVLRLRAPSA